jgi:hypothetical protein
MPGPLDNKGEELTIAVGVACPEGLVLAADSRATVIGEGYARVATDYSHKVFHIGGRFGAATFGWRFLEANTIEGVMEEFAAQTKLPKAVDELVERLKDYFGARIKKHLEAGIDQEPPEGTDVLGFIVGGYDPQGIGHIKTVYLPTGDVVAIASTAAYDCGAQWQGESDVFTRLLRGFDSMRINTESWSEEQQEAVDAVSYSARSFACRCKMRSISPLSLSGRRSTRSGSPMERLGRRAALPPAAGPSRCWL